MSAVSHFVAMPGISMPVQIGETSNGAGITLALLSDEGQVLGAVTLPANCTQQQKNEALSSLIQHQAQRLAA